jgi:hypothetical protein
MTLPIEFGPSLCNITCRCGHSADIDLFCQTPVAGTLPPAHFQCPSCKVAWHHEKTPIIVTAWGGVISEPNKTVIDQPRF